MDLTYLKNEISVSTGVADTFSNDFKEFFNDYKKKKTERPDELIRRCLEAIDRSSLGGVDINLIYEALFNAATEVGDMKLSIRCYNHLKTAFPDSIRVEILNGRYKEQCGKFADALKFYTELQLKDMSNITIMKRKVCCYKQMRNFNEAVKELHIILHTYSSDVSCWHELYELYLFYGDYEAAAYCCEEMVMIDQGLAANHSRLADVYYTLGSGGSNSTSSIAASSAKIISAGGSSSSSSSSASSTDTTLTTRSSLAQAALPCNALLTGAGNITDMEYLLLARKHYTLSLDRQAANVNPHGVYGLLAASRAIDAKINSKDKEQGQGDTTTAASASASHAASVNRELLLYARSKLDAQHLVM